MHVNSRQIVKEVNNTMRLNQALSLVVQRVKSSMDANAPSIFDSYAVMLVSDRLNAGMVARIRNGNGRAAP